jgi:hypothetical protein
MVLDSNNSHFVTTGEVMLMFGISERMYEWPKLISIQSLLTSDENQTIIPISSQLHYKQASKPIPHLHQTKMQFSRLAMALFAVVALAAPTAPPTDVEAASPTPAVDEPVIIAVPHGQVVPIPQACCWIKSGKRSFLGCGKACDHISGSGWK